MHRLVSCYGLNGPLRQYFKSISGWVGCFGINGPLSQYFSLYRAVSQRRRKKREMTDERKKVQTTPIRTYCKRSRPLPYSSKLVGRPGTGSLPSTIAPPDNPHPDGVVGWCDDAG